MNLPQSLQTLQKPAAEDDRRGRVLERGERVGWLRNGINNFVDRARGKWIMSYRTEERIV